MLRCAPFEAQGKQYDTRLGVLGEDGQASPLTPFPSLDGEGGGESSEIIRMTCMVDSNARQGTIGSV